MNILIITNNYTPYSGGVVSSINAQVKELRQLGHKVTIVTLDFLGKKHADLDWVIRLYCPIKFTYKKNHMAIVWRAKKQLTQIIKGVRPDMVHVHHPFLLGPIATKIAQNMQIRVVFTYHTVYEAYAHYVPLPEWITRKIIKKCVLAFCRKVDGVIAPSLSIKNYLVDHDIKTPIAVIPSGLLEQFLPQQIKQRPINGHTLHLLVVSRMVKEKNIGALLRVAQKLLQKKVKFKLTLIGYGDDYAYLQKYAFDRLKLPTEVVQFVHKPPKTDIAKAYQNADLFLFSSKTDTQGLVLAEAMAAGAPVIAFDGPGQRDIINGAQNGYIVSNEQKMVDTIVTLSKDHRLLNKLSQHAFATGQSYKPAVLVQELVQFYDSFL